MSGLYVINDNGASNLLKFALFTSGLMFSSKANNLPLGISSITKSSSLEKSMNWLVLIKASKSKSTAVFTSLITVTKY